MSLVVHVIGNEYDLLLNWDHGTRGHTQWYFFSVSNAQVGERYTFNIVNFCKPQSLYKNGMRPLVYSAAAAVKQGHGWTRTGYDVIYHENGVSAETRRAAASPRRLATLSFSAVRAPGRRSLFRAAAVYHLLRPARIQELGASPCPAARA